MKILVAATPRSGTLFMHKVLSHLGLNATKNQAYRKNTAGGVAENQVEVSDFAFWYAADFQDDLRVCQQVRHPIRAINSMAASWKTRKSMQGYFRKAIGVDTPDVFQLAAETWVFINKAIASASPFARFRVEEPVETMKEIADAIEPGLDLSGLPKLLEQYGTTTHRIPGDWKNHSPLPVEAIEESTRVEVVRLGGEYGYDME